MPLRESEAIILQTYPLGEADRLVSFLSRNMGRVRGVASGARRPKSRFGSTLEPLSYIRIWFYERETRDLVRINQCELIESFVETHADYSASLALSLLSEISESVLPDREPSDASFRLLLLAAQAIKRTRRTVLPLAYFCFWSTKLGGWLPSLKTCARCGRELNTEPVFISSWQVGLACTNCRASGMRLLSSAAVKAIREIESKRLDQLTEEDIPARAAREVMDYMLDVLEQQLERKLRTRTMLEAEA